MAAGSSSLRNLGRVLRNRALNTVSCGPVLDRLAGRGRSRSEVAKSIKTIFEALEARQLMSVLPAPAVADWQSLSGSSSTDSARYNTSPSTAVNPMFPNQAITVWTHNFPGATGNQKVFIDASYTNDGGATWTDISGLIPGNISDPQLTTVSSNIPYAQATDATVGFDRAGHAYISYSEHNATNAGGAIVLVRLDGMTSLNASPTLGIGNTILYQWVDNDSAWTPALTVDNNLLTYTDPSTSSLGKTLNDPYAGRVYVVWATNDANATLSPNPATNNNPFNPNTIRLVASVDQGQTFSSPMIWNDNQHDASSDKDHAVAPKIVVSQGDTKDVSDPTHVSPGQITVVWDDINSLRTANPPQDSIKSTYGTQGGAGYYLSDTSSTPITDAQLQYFVYPTNQFTGDDITSTAVHQPITADQMVVADFDGDSVLDAVVLTNSTKKLTFLTLNPSGSVMVGAQVSYPATMTSPKAVIAGDFDGDGKADVIVIDAAGAWLFKGNGDGTFNAPAAPVIAQVNLTVGAATDLDGDGDLDLLLASPGSPNRIYLATNDGTGQFIVSSNVNIGTVTPDALALADFDGDGQDDLVILSKAANTVTFVKRTGFGTFAAPSAPVALTGLTGARTLTAGDFDGDGKIDLVVVDTGGAWLLTGNGDGTFQQGLQKVTNAGLTQVGAADLDGDGDLDMVLADTLNKEVVGALNNGAGTNLIGTTVATGTTAATSVAIGDFDGDGNSDMLALDVAASTLTLWQGDGSGGYAATATTIDLGALNLSGVRSVAAGDFDGDGKLDAVVIDSQGVWLFTGNGDGTFNNPAGAALSQAGLSGAVSVADIDGDGKFDLVLSNTTLKQLVLAVNNGAGAFTASTVSTGTTIPTAVAAGDFDGDGNLDVWVFDGLNDTAAFLQGTGPGTFAAPVPTVLAPFVRGARAAITGDFDGDGNLDVALVDTKGAFLLLGDGSGGLALNHVTAEVSGTGFTGLGAADIDGDLDLDLVLADPGNTQVVSALNNGTGLNFIAQSTAAATPNVVVTGNFDAGTKLDAVVLNTQTDDLTILAGNGNGTFRTTPLSTMDLSAAGIINPRYMTTADLDGDKNLDLLIVDDNGVWVLYGAGDGTFSFRNVFPAPPTPLFFQANLGNIYTLDNSTLQTASGTAKYADFDGDKLGDFVVMDPTNNKVLVALSSNGWAPTPYSSGGVDPVAATLADMDGDNILDIVVANGGDGTVGFMLGRANGTFSVPDAATNTLLTLDSSSPATVNLKDVAVANIDGDAGGLLDVVALADNKIYTFFNRTAGAFGFNPTPVITNGKNIPTAVTEHFQSFKITDVDGDNKLDVVITNRGVDNTSGSPVEDDYVLLMFGNGAGAFTAPYLSKFLTGDSNNWTTSGANQYSSALPGEIALGDFDGNGKLDVIVPNAAEDSVTLLLRPTNPPIVPVGTTSTFDMVFSDPNFSLSDISVDLGIIHPATSELLVLLTAPNGNTVVLIRNRLNPPPLQGNFYGPGQTNPMGVTGVDLGYVLVGDKANYVGLTIGSGTRNVNDTSFNGVGTYLPEGTSFRSNQTLLEMLGYNVGQDVTGLMGTWTLTVFDMVPTNPAPPEAITHFGVRITSNALPDAGAEKQVTTTTVLGALDPNNFPRNAAVSGVTGIGPGIQIASDNTLGSFSPHQGRLYVTFVNRSTNTGNSSDNTDVMLAYSDNGGDSWILSGRVNDDNALTDGYSEAVGGIGSLTTAGRAQFQPAIAVDQFTGTLVITYFDARQDAARTRVARYIATSIDGGDTFGAQTFLNTPNQVTDASTGKTVTVGPIPDNGSTNDDPVRGLGYQQGLAVVQGVVYATWSGNENGGTNAKRLPDILTASTTIAAGPRVVDGTMGPVSTPGDLLNPAAPDGTPTLQSFVITFDRPVQLNSIITQGGSVGGQNVWVYYRPPGASGNDAGTPVALNATITVVDPVTHVPLLLDPIQGVPISLMDPNDVSAVAVRLDFQAAQTAAGTYSYYVEPTVHDLIRKPYGWQFSGHAQVTYASDAANSNLAIPAPASAGIGQVTSTIHAKDMPSSELISDLTVNVNLTHTQTGNLTLTLIDPDGNRYILLDPTSGVTGRNLNGQFTSSDNTTTVDDLATLVTGLNNGTITRTGDWKLEIQDNVSGDTGFLQNWNFVVTTYVTVSGDGNAMDQNADGINGESAWSGQTLGDVFAAPGATDQTAWDVDTKSFHTPYSGTTLPLIVAGAGLTTNDRTYVAPSTLNGNPNLGLAIPDATGPTIPGTQSSFIQIGGDGRQVIDNLTVTVKVLHASVDTLNVWLKSEDGTKVLLYAANPAITNPIQNLYNTTFDDGADTSIDLAASLSVNGIYEGVFQPAGAEVAGKGLSLFKGKTLTGKWELIVEDTQPDGTTGTIDSWSMSADTSTVIVNPTDPTSATQPSVDSIHVTFDHDMDQTLMTVPGAIPGTSSPVLRIVGPAGPIDFATTYKTTDAPKTITDNNVPVASAISIADTYNVGHVTVKFDIAHQSVGDLRISLVDPNGVAHLLVGALQSLTGANFTGTIIDDLSANTLSASSAAPFSLAAGYKPANPLDSALNNMSVKGTWKLQVTDANGNLVAGTLNSWSMTVTPQIVADPNFDVNNPDPDPANPRTYKIYLPNQKVSGTYSLILNPALADKDGNQLDSDRDAGLDALRDPVLANAIPANSPTTPPTYVTTAPYVYTRSTGVPFPVAIDASTPSVTESVLTVTDNFTLQGLTARLNLTFTNDPALDIILEAPDGTQVLLFAKGTGNFGTRANFVNTVFDDAATKTIQDGSAPYAGRFNPANPLSALVTDGVNVAGDWKLIIKNYSTTAGGSIDGFAITANKAVANTGLGEASDQATVTFRIFNLAPGNTTSSNTWTQVTGSSSGPGVSTAGGTAVLGTTLAAGAISDVAVDPSDPSGNTVFVAAASGGIWKTTNFLTSDPQGPVYVPVTDFGALNSLNIGSIAVFARNAQPGTTGKLAASIDASSTPAAYGFSLNNVSDGSFTTNYVASVADNATVVYDLGVSQYVTAVKFAPYSNFASLMVGGKFQGTNSLSGTWTDLYTVTSAPNSGTLTTGAAANPNYYRYVRYVGPVGSYAAISEMQVFGNPASTLSAGSSNLSVVVAGTGQGTAGSYSNSGTNGGQTGGANQLGAAAIGSGAVSPGVGFLISSDGGATWNLFDSTTNVDGSGNILPMNSPARDHKFVGTTTYKVVVDPRPTLSGEVIIYAALSGPNGGLWRSVDSGKHWSNVSDPNGTTGLDDCTDIILDYNSGTVNSVSNPTGNLTRMYAGFRGKGVYQSPNGGQSWLPLLGSDGTAPTGATPGVRDNVAGTPALKVDNEGNPQGNKGRIVLAMPSPTGDVTADTLHEGWIYAAVVTATADDYFGKLDGLYVTKDFGLNWTKIPLDRLSAANGGSPPPIVPSNDGNSGLTYNIVDGRGEPQGEGNHSLSLTVDPTNPAVIYVSGSGWATDGAFGVVRVDTTRMYDAHAFYTPQDANDGGKLQLNINAAVNTKDLNNLGAYNPFGTGVGPQYINLVRNPNNPFVNNTTFYTDNVTGFVNSGSDAWWTPIDDYFSLPVGGANVNTQRIISMIDPLTGQTRLLLATDTGLYAAVTNADGTLNTGVGTATVGNGSRNGNLATLQVNSGAIQPGSLAAQLAGAMFYAMSNASGMTVSDPNVLTTGNTTGQDNYNSGMGSNVATDQTGSGTAYSEFIPGILGTDFFQVFAPGTSTGNSFINFSLNGPVNAGVGRTFGLITTGTNQGAAGDTQDDNWPDRLAFDFTVNPVNGNQLMAGTFLGAVFATYNQGLFWSKIASPADLDGSIAGAFAFGAPDANVGDSTSSLVYVGTTGVYGSTGASTPAPTSSRGHVYVSFTGGGSSAGNAWVDLDPTGLDGSPVRSIVTNPTRGSHELYVVTDAGVYHMADSSAPGATWTKIVGDLPTGTAAGTWTTVLADWRYQLPNAGNQGGTHPVLYVAGDAGVYRSLDNGTTWRLFPNQDPTLDAAPADGGYLPHARVTDLDLGIGNVDPTTGYTDVASGPSVLLASTYGRGQYAIRVAPLMQGAKFGADDSSGNRTLTGLSQINAYGNKMSFRVYDMSDPANPVDITSATYLRDGSLHTNPDGTTSWLPNALGADGTFSVSVDSSYAANALAIQAVDAAGVAGPMVTLLVPPSTPSAPDLAASSDSGTSNSDDLTNVRKPTINDGGNLLPAGNTVIVYLNGVAVGSPITVAGDGTWSFTFPSNLADGVYAVTINQTDPSNQSSAQSPALTLTIDGAGPAGTPKPIPSTTSNVAITNVTTANFSDPHGVINATINWGDGTSSAGTLVAAAGGTWDVKGSHTYTFAGTYTVTTSVSDNAGNTSSVTSQASVTAPVYTFSVTGQAFNPTEGSPFNGKVAILTDGNLSHTASDLTATINWGDGTSSAGTIVAGSAGTFNVFGTHTYDDNRQDQTAYDVSVTVTSTTDGKHDTKGSVADVSNVIPTGTVSNPGAIYLGDSVTLTLTANDVSAADRAAGFDYVINWGDGTQDVVTHTPGNGAGVSRTHKFNSVSTAITVSISDKDAARRAGTRVITTPITVKTTPALNGSAVNGNANRSDISQITFNVSNTDIVGGLSLSNLKLFYNGDGVNPVSLAGAILTFDPASGNGTLDLTHLTTALRDGDYQLQITVAGKLLPPISFFKLRGDINGDGIVDAKDLALINKSLGKSSGQAGFNAAADLNHDGVVNAADVTLYNTLKNHKATGGTATLTLQTGKAGAIPTLDFGKVAVNTNGGYIDLVIKNVNANYTELKIGTITMAGAGFSFAFPGQAWGSITADTKLALPYHSSVKIRVYLKQSTKVQNLAGKLKFYFATKTSNDYKDVTVPVKATIVAAAAAVKAKAVKTKAVKKH